MDSLIRNSQQLFEAIDSCLNKKLLLPCLSLVYTGMDVHASLEQRPDERVRGAFTRWVDRYVVRGDCLPCSALELYAARCGVLHTFTANSELFRSGKVRQIFYAWGTARVEALQESIDALDRHVLAVHVSDLVSAFRQGVADYFEEIADSPKLQAVVGKNAGLWFTNLDPSMIDAFNAMRGGEDAT
jgi:hypothetical protein